MIDFKEWDGFKGRIWKEEVNTRDFIIRNYTPYDGNSDFLAPATDAPIATSNATFSFGAHSA